MSDKKKGFAKPSSCLQTQQVVLLPGFLLANIITVPAQNPWKK
jgi:hypothetical protein